MPSDAQAAKDRLMEAAEACFDKYGVAKTTMDDIAKVAGVSRPTVYRHFDDRDSLILAVVMRRSRQLIDRAQKFIRKQGTFEDQLVEGLLFLVDKGRKDPFVSLLVSPESMDLANQILGASTAAVDLAYEMWEPILADARGRGELRADLDFRAIATWLTYLILLLVGRGDIEPDVSAQREMLRTFVAPAFAPTPAEPAPPSAARSTRATKRA
ncbi:MAG TPA: TetR/AcrR family transcriptional regulator [Acidimicrobiia bacterium]|nr:TetR/AcrR family transcriptional regulator [Acidimicrobiia bacterium]